jgi:IS1 family transposase
VEIFMGELSSEVSDNQGDMWSFVCVCPESGFIHTVHTSARNLEEATVFVGKIKENSDGVAPLVMSDSWFYERALVDNYSTLETPPYKGIGRKPHPIQVVDPNLGYAQVHKERNPKGKITKISTRIVLGDEIAILNKLEDASRSKTVNTDYVESRNGKYRKSNVRLARKTLCHSKKAIFHRANIDFLTQVMNYTWTQDHLKVVINPNAAKFEQKYEHKTTAMAENLIDKVLTIKELLFIRPKRKAAA